MESITVSTSGDINNGLASLVDAAEIEAEPPLKNELANDSQLSNPLSKTVNETQELSWEKIAAEVVEGEDETAQLGDQLVINESSSAQLEVVDSEIEPLEFSQDFREAPRPVESSFSEVSSVDTTREIFSDEVTPQIEAPKSDQEPEVINSVSENVEPSIEESSFATSNEEVAEPEKSEIIEIQQEEVTEFHEATEIQDRVSVEFNAIPHEGHDETVLEDESIVEVSQSALEEEIIHDDHVLEVPSNNVTEEIQGLKSEDVAVVAGVEYTVVAEEVETHETIEEHLAQTNAAITSSTTETVLIINPDQTQTEIRIEQIDDDKNEDNSQYNEDVYYIDQANESVDDPLEGNAEAPKPKPKKPRGRKPIGDIPLHVLGRDISKPTEGVSNGGRTMPKPRLGVKVPYRNLTSQIVSKQDIEKEIMERFKQKQEQNVAQSGDVMFARKLTQRLAKKLIPDKENSEKKVLQSTSSSSTTLNSGQSEIKDNSDLLAILEGEDDIVPVKPFAKKEMSKETEREIALKQLSELPNLSSTPEKKFFKSRDEDRKEKGVEKKKDTTQAENNADKSLNKHIAVQKSFSSENAEVEDPFLDTPVKETSTTKEKSKAATFLNEKAKQEATSSKIPQKITYVTKSIEKKIVSDVEPRLKTGAVLKTYTRKRKSTDTEPVITPQKKAIVLVTNLKQEEEKPTSHVYVTKSSRVIKKKVIWDPDDEVPFRSPVLKTAKPIGRPPKEDKKNDASPPKKVAKSELTSTRPVGRPPSDKKIDHDKSFEKKLKEKKEATIKSSSNAKISPPKRLKRLTEVDKLLMDEGAVNMLYDVNTNDELIQGKKKNAKPTINLDKAHKELMSKTNVIKNELLQQHTSSKDGQVTLRKKEGPSPTKKDLLFAKKDVFPPSLQRKKSKDSTRSTPPASPAFNAAEASRIIRRHSSSSFSSGDEITVEGMKRKSSTSEQQPRKKAKKNDVKPVTKDVSKNNNNSLDETKVNNVENSLSQNKDFTLTKRNKHATIKLLGIEGKYFLTEPLLKQLIMTLKDLGKDDECHVVSIISDSKDHFCDGLNYSQIVDESDSILKKKATELAALVKEFLKCILHFPKVLVAGIQGTCVGLGVTMLPLFDMVIASDNSTFRTPYAKLGCIPEAGFLLTVPFLNSHGLASELLYSCQTIEADDACRKGLVTKLCWPEKYQEEYRTMLNSLANKSFQSILASKQQLRQHILDFAEAALNPINKLLVENWTSAECQESFAK